jgi:hypothetical protein
LTLSVADSVSDDSVSDNQTLSVADSVSDNQTLSAMTGQSASGDSLSDSPLITAQRVSRRARPRPGGLEGAVEVARPLRQLA